VLAASLLPRSRSWTGDDYGEAQQQAWASAADDEEQFASAWAENSTLIATLQNSPVGFASLKGADHIDMLYVHPSAVGQGVASMLCEALENSPAAAAPRVSPSTPATTRRNFREARLRRQAAQHRDRQRRMARQYTMQKALADWHVVRSSDMTRERLYLFDTTLRDGAQTNGVDFTLQ